MMKEREQINRCGAYGIILKNCQILLTLKKSGPYKGLWGLPGGAIEFGETPEEALKRELLEETALATGHIELSSITTSNGSYDNNGKRYDFHHIGIIYKVSDSTLMPDLIPEEEGRWVFLSAINQKELTPFAQHALKELTL